MEKLCEYCGNKLKDTQEKCPSCGAANKNYKRTSNEIPKTIEELRNWYVNHCLPPEDVTRFFIGKNVEEPRAFGIYYDDVDKKYIVYKNKDTGERKIRYQGKDEAYAVNELYLKLKEEILNQKSHNRNNNSSTPFYFGKLTFIHFFSVFIAFFVCGLLNTSPLPALVLFITMNPGIFIYLLICTKVRDYNKQKTIDTVWHIASFALSLIVFLSPGIKNIQIHNNDAYYTNNNSLYYNYGGSWYEYINGDWSSYSGSTDNFKYSSKDYNNDYDAQSFDRSSYYEGSGFWNGIKNSAGSSGWSSGGSSSPWDSGSSWDSSDSWDSGSTDWGSDW